MLSNGTLYQYLHRCPKERFLNMSHRILATNTHAITNLSKKLKKINQSFLSFLLLMTSYRDLYTILWEAKLVIDLLLLIDLVGTESNSLRTSTRCVPLSPLSLVNLLCISVIEPQN